MLTPFTLAEPMGEPTAYVGPGSRSGPGALLVGYYEDGRLRFGGKVGTGFTRVRTKRAHPRTRRRPSNRSP
jgi:bifunctional non-homologous end joining protein LigD